MSGDRMSYYHRVGIAVQVGLWLYIILSIVFEFKNFDGFILLNTLFLATGVGAGLLVWYKYLKHQGDE